MDKTVPRGAALLLDFVGNVETSRGAREAYDVVYGHNQKKLPKPLTSMTVDEVIVAGPKWAKQFGSSAAGRYQFMNATLKELKKELGLGGDQVLDADLQDRLGYHLLKRRGYEAFMAGTLKPVAFAKNLAKEWASLPVLQTTKGAHRQVARGQSYYAGDGLNKSLVQPHNVEAVLSAALAAGNELPKPRADLDPAKPQNWLAVLIAFVIKLFGDLIGLGKK